MASAWALVEFENDAQPHLRLMNHMSNVNANEFGRIYDPDITNMGNRSRAWNKTKKSLGKAASMSKRSKEYRQRYQDLTRAMELKKFKGEAPTERDMKAMWKAQDDIQQLEKEVDHFYNKNARTAALSTALDSKHLRGRGRRR